MSALGRDGEFRLADLGFLGDTEDLRARALEQVRAAGQDFRGPGVHEGADASDSIWVAVDGRGEVHGVEISRQWRDRLSVGRFADALFQAYTGAVRRAMDAAAVSALAAEPHSAEAGNVDAVVDSEQDQQPKGEREWRIATWETLYDVKAALGRLQRAAADGEAGGGSVDTRRSPSGYLTARLSGHGIVGISGDVRMIAAADVEHLRQEALAVLHAGSPPGRR